MSNRNYKEIPKKQLEFFKLFRHYRLNIYVISQGIDIDIVIRRLTNKWYKLVRKELNFIFFKVRTNFVDLVEVENNLVIQNGDWQLNYTPGNIIATFNITKAFKYFNSFDLPEGLKHYDLPYWIPLKIEEAEPTNKPKKTYSLFSRLRAKVSERYTRLSAGEEVQQDYKNLSREELLELWKKSQN